MKKLLFATTALFTLATGIASAADLPVAYKAPIARPACAQFGGFYVGANIGWAYHDSNWVDRDNWIDNFGNDFNSSSPSTTRNGVVGGLQGGYNWQSGCTVFGVEIDASWAGLSGTKTYTPAVGGTVLTIDDKVSWWGTARTRSGIVVDNLLLYVTGGLAYANIKHNWTINDPAPATEAFSAKSGRWGWVGGVGTEWAWTSNVSIKTEVLYVRFAESNTQGFSVAGGQTVNFDQRDSMWVSRIGVNVKFGGPVYAAY